MSAILDIILERERERERERGGEGEGESGRERERERVVVLNATFNNISVVSWRSVFIKLLN